MEQIEEVKEIIFVPLIPGPGIRRGIMLSTAIPGFVLILASTSLSVDTVGGLLLKVFSICSGLAVLILSVMEYRKSGSNRWMGIDMITMLTGLLIITQGAAAYRPLKDFQPAHLLFLAGAIYIFKGVMFPEAKMKRGFTISDSEIIFRRTMLTPVKKIQLINLNIISLAGDKLVFELKESKNLYINLKGYANRQEIFESLSAAVNT